MLLYLLLNMNLVIKQFLIQLFVGLSLLNVNKDTVNLTPIIHTYKLCPFYYRCRCINMYFSHLLYTDMLMARVGLEEIKSMKKWQI